MWTGWAGFFLLGAISLVIQTLLVREALFAFHGGEIAIGLFFAVWLCGIAAGAALGSRLAARRRAGKGTWAAYCFFSRGLALLPWVGMAQIAAFRVHRAILPVGVGGYLPALAYIPLLLVAAAPAGILTGLLFPMGLRAWRITPGVAYGLEAMGSMAGGAFAALYALARIAPLTLVSLAGPPTLLWLLLPSVSSLSRAPAHGEAESGESPRGDPSAGSPMTGNSTEVDSRPMRCRDRIMACVLSGLLAIALITGVAPRVDECFLHMRWDLLGTGTEPRSAIDTPYHHVTIGSLGGEASLYLDGLYYGGLEDPYVDSLSAAIIATQHPHPGRTLVLSPSFSGPVPVLAAARGVSLTLVREDESIERAIERGAPRFAETCASVRRSGQVALVTADPREAVRRLQEPVDLMAVLYGGASTGAANRLYTSEFFADCARGLRESGVLVLSIPGAANVASPEDEILRNSIFAAMRMVFGDVRISPGPTHYLFAALPHGGLSRPRASEALESPLTWDPDTLAARRARLWPGGRHWPAALFAALFPTERIEGLQSIVMHRIQEGAGPNRDSHPLVYYQQIRRWDRLSGSGMAGFLKAWHQAPWPWSLGMLAFLTVLGLVARRRWGQPVVSLASTGMAGMGASLLLLLLFQTYLGTLYLKVGLIAALFMTGLGLGAYLGSWLLRRGRGGQGVGRGAVVASDLLWVVFFLALLPLISAMPRMRIAGLEGLLLALALLAGVLTALPFPWVAWLVRVAQCQETAPTGPLHETGGGSATAAAGGIADAADHMGAVFGALVTGTFLVPLLGFQGTLLLLAGLKALSALGGALPGWPYARNRR